MTKEDKIQEAYGEYWETSRRYIDFSNGTIYNRDRNFDIHNGFFEQVKVNGENKFRPKSLQGIENNNGWISLKESGLPKEEIDCHFIFLKNNSKYQTFGVFDKKLSSFWSGSIRITNVTHYQPIEKPQPPIY